MGHRVHTVKPTHLFQNTTRRLPKFPRTHRGDILPFVVVAKKHCAQILATMRALLYDFDANSAKILGVTQYFGNSPDRIAENLPKNPDSRA